MNKKIIGISLSLIIPILGQALENGIYPIADKKTDLTVTVSGKKIYLDQKTEIEILRTDLYSNDNSNENFTFLIYYPYQKKMLDIYHILIVNDKAYKQNGSGSTQDTEMDLAFSINGQKNAEEIGMFFKTKPILRKHPGYLLQVDFTTEKTEFQKGEEIFATIKIKNIGTTPFAFQVGGMNRAERDNQYLFHAYLNGKQVEDIGTTYHFGGLSISQILKPGEVFENKISLAKWFKFEASGFYEIFGSFYMYFYDSNNPNDYHILWQDLVSGNFYFNLK